MLKHAEARRAPVAGISGRTALGFKSLKAVASPPRRLGQARRGATCVTAVLNVTQDSFDTEVLQVSNQSLNHSINFLPSLY
jgi:hypothetical protein